MNVGEVVVHQAWDGCGSEIAVNTLAKGEPRVNTDSKTVREASLLEAFSLI